MGIIFIGNITVLTKLIENILKNIEEKAWE